MTTEQRLHKIEDEFETVKQLLASAARYAESANDRCDRNSAAIDRLQESQAASFAAIDRLEESQAASAARLDEFIFQSQRIHAQLSESSTQHAGRLERLDGVAAMLSRLQDRQQASLNRLDDLFVRQQEILDRQTQESEEFRRTTNAALERIDRLLDYLIRQQDRNADS